MLIESAKYSASIYKEKFKSNFLTITLLFIFSFIIDISRELIGATSETALIVHGLIETVGTCFFYSILLNELLGIKKLSILNFFTYLRVNILYSIFYLIGSAFLVVPGLYILTFFYFAPIIALEGKESGSYFKKSKVLVKKLPWSIFGLSLSLLLLMAFDFWFLGFVKENASTEIIKYCLFLVSNVVIILLDYFLFIFTIYLYRQAHKA